MQQEIGKTYSKLLDEFEALPEQIKAEKLLLLGLENKKRDAEHKMSIKKGSIMTDIFNETKEGKPLFSNAEKREVECNKRLAVNQDYLILKDEYQKLEQKISEKKIEIEFLERTFSRIKYFILFLNATRKE